MKGSISARTSKQALGYSKLLSIAQLKRSMSSRPSAKHRAIYPHELGRDDIDYHSKNFSASPRANNPYGSTPSLASQSSNGRSTDLKVRLPRPWALLVRYGCQPVVREEVRRRAVISGSGHSGHNKTDSTVRMLARDARRSLE